MKDSDLLQKQARVFLKKIYNKKVTKRGWIFVKKIVFLARNCLLFQGICTILALDKFPLKKCGRKAGSVDNLKLGRNRNSLAIHN